MSETFSNSSPPTDASALIGKLLSNPDLIRNLSSVLGASGTGTTPTSEAQTPPSSPNVPPAENNQAVADGISRVLSNPEMMAKLPDVMKMLAPMMQQAQSSSSGASVPAIATPPHGGGDRDRRGCRNDLLLALKPFLSPERCRAIDMLLGLSRLGDVLQKMV
jgi:hypothetical protein